MYTVLHTDSVYCTARLHCPILAFAVGVCVYDKE